MFAHFRKPEIRMVSQALAVEPTLLISWIQGLVRLRNLCAHHSRVWNKTFSHSLSIHGKLPNELVGDLTPNNKMYAYVSVMMYFLKQISPDTKWAKKLVTLLDEHHKINISDMAFPLDWKERDLWKNHTK